MSYFGSERERTATNLNLYDFDIDKSTGKYDMPVILSEKHVPKALMSFNYMLSRNDFEKGIHFFLDDYQFERVWNNPIKYFGRLSKFDCALTPDFSLYLDMPIAMQIWQVYKNRLIGQMMHDYGVKTIPTIAWSDARSYEFCFDGVEPNGTIAVSTVGVMRSKQAKELWYKGMEEAEKRLSPSHVLVYGSDIGYEFKCEYTYYGNSNAEGLRNRGGKHGR